jgi:hypothetical protein
MNVFFDLFIRNGARADWQSDPYWADREFPSAVAVSPYHLWRPGDAVAPAARRLLIGVATWSGYDMRLLDALADAFPANGTGAMRIDLFNTAECRSQQDFQGYIPGLDDVLQTPVVGVWRQGRLTDVAQGFHARELAAREVGIDPLAAGLPRSHS